MPLPYQARIRIAADQGDLYRLADLVREGADGSRILSNDEVAELAKAIRFVARRHRTQSIVAIVVTVVVAAAAAVVHLA